MPCSILLLSNVPQRAELFYRCLDDSEFRITAESGLDADLAAVAADCQPDLVIIDCDTTDERLLSAIRQLCCNKALPVVLLAQQDDQAMIRKAVQTGVSSHIVGAFEPRRIANILHVAMARFQETERLKSELQVTRASLAERKIVERAKGLLMKQKGLDEAQAYHALRKLAMDRNLRIGQAAENVIAVAEMLEA